MPPIQPKSLAHFPVKHKLLNRASVLGLFLGGFIAHSSALAQASNTSNTTYPITQAQRLSDWLQANRKASNASFALATAWTTPEALAEQQQAHQALVKQLQSALLKPSTNTFFQWLQNQAATGRVQLPSVNAEWLSANDIRNPGLRAGDSISLQQPHGQVMLLGAEGQACRMPHTPGAYPSDYLQACAFSSKLSLETVWVVQANGRTQAVSVAPWNPMPQPQLAPHAVVFTGWPTHVLSPNISAAQRTALNEATATWLSQRTDGLTSLIPSWSESKPIKLTSEPDYELTGIARARFAPEPSSSNWGVVGLVQTPTARMRPAGSISTSFYRTWPYSNLNVMFQPLDWLEAGFRYTDVANRLYGPDIAGNQSYKDKSFELKAHLWPESTYLPSVATGIRDLGGTGLFGGEYVVANKRWGRLDFSAGMGWGYVGGRQNLSNPLRVVSKQFDVRQNDTGSGGTVSTKAFFRGPASVFGGVEYQTPWNMVLKAEYDGNNYQHEPQNNNQVQKSAFNFGMVYRISPGIELSLSRERGTTWGLGFTFYSDWSKLNQYKLRDKPTPAVAQLRPQTEPNWAQTRKELDDITQWEVDAIQREGKQLILDVSNGISPYHGPRVNKAMAVIHRDAPAHIDQVELRYHSLGDVLMVDRIDRQAWVNSMTEPERTDTSKAQDAQKRQASLVSTHYPQANSLPGTLNWHDPKQPRATTLVSKKPDLYTLTPGFSFNHILGGPDAFLLYQLSAGVSGQLSLPGRVYLHGAVNAGLINNYDLFKYTAPSNLPRVRTYLREFVTESRVTMPTLYAAKAERLSTNWSAAVYGGYLESMYAGVGGELLYRQPGSKWAAGVDLNKVQQRDFAQNFALRDYKANTGNASLYWQTPWQDINMAVSVGQYLAGDKGASLSLTKVFSNGVTMGAFATKTNVSAAQFGEGSFNKGVYWSIPFDAITTRSSRTTANFNWTPLTRDGGAMLNRPVQLIGGTNLLDPRTLTQRPANRPAEQLIPDDLGR
jgi:hypothetical protein